MTLPAHPKYSEEFLLEFQSVDRFMYRVCDLYAQQEEVDSTLLDRLDHCHLYLLGKRPRLTLVPETVDSSAVSVNFEIQYKFDGALRRAKIQLPRTLFGADEIRFESSPYPHRELLGRNEKGEIVSSNLLANHFHLLPKIEQPARNLEVVYVGKGLRRSAQDRLRNHEKLQKILAEINANDPDSEVFALVYAFACRKQSIGMPGIPPEIAGETANRRRRKVVDYHPCLEEQISLVEAACISYFRPEKYNSQYLDFPNPREQILRPIYERDFAAIIVQLDNTNIGSLRTFSASTEARSTHYIVIDFRKLEQRESLLDNLPGVGPRATP